MGYREYFVKVRKRDVNKVRKLNSVELYEWCKNNNVDIDEYDNKDWYVSFNDIVDAIKGEVVFEFGKWYENGDSIDKLGKPFFKDKSLLDKFSDYNAYIVGKEAVESAIEWQHKKILSHFNTLLLDKEERQGLDHYDDRTKEQRMEEAIRSKIHEWDNPWTKPYKLKENSNCMVRSWLYEYTIFELVRLYNTTNWNTECLIFYGW